MLAFHDDPALKAFYLARLAAHEAADEIRHGPWWSGRTGCAAGCTIHADDLQLYPTLLGIPAEIAALKVAVSEGLPHAPAKRWPLRFIEAVNVGADLRGIDSDLLDWLETTCPSPAHAGYERDEQPSAAWMRCAAACLPSPIWGPPRYASRAETRRMAVTMSGVLLRLLAGREGRSEQRLAGLERS